LTTDSSSDVHVEAVKIREQIEKHLGLDGNSLLFDFRNQDGRAKLDLITVNARHNQSFLFHTVTGYDRLDALRQMLEYARNYRDKESSFTIQWMARGERELQTSYFRASNVYDALDKLYYGRDINTITVFSVVLNPIA
jgi:hypothetical protein